MASPKKARKRYAFTIVMGSLGILLLAGYLVPQVQFSLFSSPSQRNFSIRLNYPATLPIAGERNYTSKLEAALSSMSGIEGIESVSRADHAIVSISFEKGTDMKFTRLHLRSIVRRVHADFPGTIPFPEVVAGNSIERGVSRILTYGIFVKEEANNFPDLLESKSKEYLSFLEGIDRIDVQGGKDSSLLLYLDAQKCAKWNISISKVLNAIEEQGFKKVIQLKDSKDHSNLNMAIEAKSILELGGIAVGNYEGQVITLEEIAHWQLKESYRRTIYKINGEETYSISFDVLPSSNVLEVGKRVKVQMEKLRHELVGKAEVVLLFDKVEPVKDKLNSLIWQNVSALLALFVVVSLLSRKARYAGILLWSLLVILACTIIGIVYLGISINLFSLAAAIVSFGIIADNSILMIETVGKKRKAQEAKIPILVASLTSIIGIGSIYFLPENLILNLESFAQLLILAILSSVLVAWMLIPALVDIWNFQLPQVQPSRMHWIKEGLYKVYLFVNKRKKWMLAILIWMLGIPIFLLPAKWEQAHTMATFYNKTIGSRMYQDQIRDYLDPLLGTSLYVFSNKAKGRYFEAEQIAPQILVNISPLDRRNGLGLAQMLEAFEDILKPFTHKLQFQSYLKQGIKAKIDIQFKEGYRDIFPYQIKSMLDMFASKYGNILIEVVGIGMPSTPHIRNRIPPSVILELKGYDYDGLNEYIGQLTDTILSHPRVDSVNRFAKMGSEDRIQSQTSLVLDPMKLKTYGHSFPSFLDQLKMIDRGEMSSSTMIVNQASGVEKSLPYLIKREDYEQSWSQLSRQPIYSLSPAQSSGNRAVPMNQMFQMIPSQSQAAIYREDQSYKRKITYVYKGASTFAQRHIDRVLKNFETILPPAYEVEQLPLIYFLSRG